VQIESWQVGHLILPDQPEPLTVTYRLTTAAGGFRFVQLTLKRAGGVLMYRSFCLTVVLLALAGPALGQRITASIRGTVTDGTGAVVPGASVTVKGEETGFTR